MERYVTFDSHVHVMNASRLRSGWRWLRKHYDALPEGPPPAPWALAEELRRGGVKGYFNFFFPIFAGTSRLVNEWNDGFCAGDPAAIPFLSLHPDDTPAERTALVTDFIEKRAFAGLKIHSYVQDIRLDAAWLPDVLAVLQNDRKVLVVHTGFAQFYGYHARYPEEEMAAHLTRILEAFPGLTVIASHMFFPRLDLARRLLTTYPNCMADTTNVPQYMYEADLAGPALSLMEEFADRILFGTDLGLIHLPHDRLVADFEALPLSAAARRRIGGETARRLVTSLGLRRAARGEAQDGVW